MNTNLKPEDFWPDAEKLLDNHYRSKRRIKAAFWILSVLTITGTLFFLSLDKKDVSVNTDKSNETPVAVSGNKSISENKTSPQNTSVIINDQNISLQKTTTQKNSVSTRPVNDQTANNNEVKNSGNFTKAEKSDNSISKKLNEQNLISNAEKNTSINANPTISTELKQKSQNSIEQARNSAKDNTLINTTSEISNENHNATSAITQSTLSDVKSKEEFFPLASIQSRGFSTLETNKTPGLLNTERGSEIKETKTKYPAEYRLEVLAGANQVTKSISGFQNLMVENKRNSWETEVITPQLNVAVSRTTDHYSIALGLNYIQYGEKVNYDPAVKSKFLVDNSYWNTYTTTVTDTDTNFVYGFVYFTQQISQRLDSNYIHQTDSVEQTIINNNIVKSTGTNVISYVEMPLTVSYYFGKQKFKYGVSTGISAGMLVYSKGYYLNNQGNDVIRLNDPELFRKVIVNGQVGLELKYCLTPALNFLVRPRYQMNLNSIVKDEAGFKQKYSAVGISAGVSFLIR